MFLYGVSDDQRFTKIIFETCDDSGFTNFNPLTITFHAFGEKDFSAIKIDRFLRKQ